MSVSNSQQDSSSQCPSQAFADLMEKAERQMKKKGYSYDGIYQHRSKWRQMAHYFREQFGDDTFSVTKAAAFLESEGILFDQSGKSPDPKQWRIRAAVRSLTDVALPVSRFPERVSTSCRINGSQCLKLSSII